MGLFQSVEGGYRKVYSERGRVSSGSSRRVFVVYPGESIRFSVKVYGPVGHQVEVFVRGLSALIAVVSVIPDRGTAPFTSTVNIRVGEDVSPGVYPFDLLLYDNAEGRIIGQELLGLEVLSSHIPKKVYKHIVKLRKIYFGEKLGAQGVIWYLLSKIFVRGASFTELKKAYDLIRGGPVAKATVAVLLRRMVRKGLIYKGENGKYYPAVTKGEIAYSRIDRSRVRLPIKWKSKETIKLTSRGKSDPYVVRLALNRAQKIMRKHGKLPAAYFLFHSLIGVRETGFLLLWAGDMFIYCENKTGMCHYIYSKLLERYFNQLGLQQGVQYNRSQDQIEARRIADRYVRKYYGSHQSARRLHYKLKKTGLIEYGGEVYTAEILYYNDGSIGVKLWDNNMDEVFYEELYKNKTITSREIKPVFPYEHIYEPNEETYFHNPAGLY